MAVIDVVDASALSYDAFCARYMAANRPVLLRKVTARWFPLAAQWSKPVSSSATGSDSRFEINYEFLRGKYGHATVPVVDGAVVEYGSEARATMTFAEYLTLLESKLAGKRYLKDWHFVRAFSQEELYTTPTFFEDDWMNWWWDQKQNSGDDYRFVYMGPAGSWTPLHQDVLRSYSWSVNVCGRKEWIFFHPDDEAKLKDQFGRFTIPDFTMANVDPKQFPHVNEATPIYVTQEAGDAIFVPSGWYHQVTNLEDTVSINHNWFNGYNVLDMWHFLQREYEAVEAELASLKELGLEGREFRDQCQLVMNANTGINYHEFRALLRAKASDLAEKLLLSDTESEDAQTALQQHLETTNSILKSLDAYFAADC